MFSVLNIITRIIVCTSRETIYRIAHMQFHPQFFSCHPYYFHICGGICWFVWGQWFTSLCLLLLCIGHVLYLPAAAAGCVRVCGGVRRGDVPRTGGVELGLLGLCCCLKKGLSKRPGSQDDTQPYTPEHKKQTCMTRTRSDAPGQKDVGKVDETGRQDRQKQEEGEQEENKRSQSQTGPKFIPRGEWEAEIEGDRNQRSKSGGASD